MLLEATCHLLMMHTRKGYVTFSSTSSIDANGIKVLDCHKYAFFLSVNMHVD